MTDRFQPPGWAHWLAGLLLLYAALFLGFAATGAGIVASAANLRVQSVLWLASAALALSLARLPGGPATTRPRQPPAEREGLYPRMTS